MDDNGANQNIYKEFPRVLLNDIKYVLKRRIGIVSLIPLAIVAAVAVNYYYQYQLLKTNPAKVVARENKDLIGAISRHLILPAGEEPTVATVSDQDLLKDQPFFVNAQKGDKVLIYNIAKKVVLYNPETDRIVEVAPINTSSQSNPSEPKSP